MPKQEGMMQTDMLVPATEDSEPYTTKTYMSEPLSTERTANHN